jgi:hypothetical protein
VVLETLADVSGLVSVVAVDVEVDEVLSVGA